MTARYVAKALGWDTRELTENTRHANGEPVEPYGIWDTQEHQWVDRWGRLDPDYWCTSRDVARMRARDLRDMACA